MIPVIAFCYYCYRRNNICVNFIFNIFSGLMAVFPFYFSRWKFNAQWQYIINGPHEMVIFCHRSRIYKVVTCRRVVAETHK